MTRLKPPLVLYAIVILAIVALILLLTSGRTVAAESNRCPWPKCLDKIKDGDLLCDWFKDGKHVKVHGKHILEVHLRRLK